MEQKTIREVKFGEYIRFKEDGPVYIRGEFCRASKRYAATSTDDINKVRYLKGDKFVFIGFTY